MEYDNAELMQVHKDLGPTVYAIWWRGNNPAAIIEALNMYAKEIQTTEDAKRKEEQESGN